MRARQVSLVELYYQFFSGPVATLVKKREIFKNEMFNLQATSSAPYIRKFRLRSAVSSVCLSKCVAIYRLKLLAEASPHSHVFPFLGVYFPTFDSFDFL